jgi:hypothetical protein
LFSSEVLAVQELAPIHCHRCDERLPESAAFCPSCGSPVMPARLRQLRAEERLATLRPALFLLPGPMRVVKFVEFNVVYEAADNAIAVALGAADTEDCRCGCHIFVIPIVCAWWLSKN